MTTPSTNGHGNDTFSGAKDSFRNAQSSLLGTASRIASDPIAMNLLTDAVNNLQTTLSREALMKSSVDPRRSIEDECGYPPMTMQVGADLFRVLYDRVGPANRVVQLFPKCCFQVKPEVYETEDADTTTPFEEAWDNLGRSLSVGTSYYADDMGSRVWEYLQRGDSLSRVGQFGIILLGIDDGKNLQEPIDGMIELVWDNQPIKQQGQQKSPGPPPGGSSPRPIKTPLSATQGNGKTAPNPMPGTQPNTDPNDPLSKSKSTGQPQQTPNQMQMPNVGQPQQPGTPSSSHIVRKPVGVKAPMADSPMQPHEEAAMRNPELAAKEVWDKTTREQLPDGRTQPKVQTRKITPPPLTNAEQLIVNEWAAYRDHVATTEATIKHLVRNGQNEWAARIAVSSKVPGEAMTLTLNERQAVGRGYTSLVLNRRTDNVLPGVQRSGNVVPFQAKKPPIPPVAVPRPPRKPLEPNALFQQTPLDHTGAPLQSDDTLPTGAGPMFPKQVGKGPASPAAPDDGTNPYGQVGATQTGKPQPANNPVPGYGESDPDNDLGPEDDRGPDRRTQLKSGGEVGDTFAFGQHGTSPPPANVPPGAIPSVDDGKANGEDSNLPPGMKRQPGGSPGKQGTDRNYDDNDPAWSAGYGMPPSAMSGTDQQYYGVQLGPSEQLAHDAEAQTPKKLIFLRCFDESLVQVVRYEWNIRNPRFGMPVMYRVILNDPRETHSGIGLPMATVFVHWSRVIHLADVHANAGASEIFAPPPLRPVLNYILDILKVPGAAAEGYWQSGTPTKVFSTHPQLGGDVLVDKQEVSDDVENLINSLQKYLIGKGGTWSLLAPSMVDPTPYIEGLINLICMTIGCPVRVFKGSERGELASSQDDAQWNDQIRNRQNGYVTPRIICPFIDRLVGVGVLPVPNEGYHVDWPDLDSLNDKDKAAIFASLMQGLGAYKQSGIETDIPLPEVLSKFTGGLFDEEEIAALGAAQQQQNAIAQQQQAAQQQQMIEQFGYKPAPPPGMIDPEQQDREHDQAMAAATNPAGAQQPPGMMGFGAGTMPGGSPPSKPGGGSGFPPKSGPPGSGSGGTPNLPGGGPNSVKGGITGAGGQGAAGGAIQPPTVGKIALSPLSASSSMPSGMNHGVADQSKKSPSNPFIRNVWSLNFDQDQERDDHGRFTESSGSSSVHYDSLLTAVKSAGKETPLTGDSSNGRLLKEDMKRLVESLGGQVKFKNMKGKFGEHKSKSGKVVITIDSSASPNMQAHSLAHEAAHFIIGHHNFGFSPFAEHEAETVAHLVSKLYGVDSTSFSAGRIKSLPFGADVLHEKEMKDQIEAAVRKMTVPTRNEFNAAEERDQAGKWTSSGGTDAGQKPGLIDRVKSFFGGKSKHSGEAIDETTEQQQDVGDANDIAELFGGHEEAHAAAEAANDMVASGDASGAFDHTDAAAVFSNKFAGAAAKMAAQIVAKVPMGRPVAEAIAKAHDAATKVAESTVKSLVDRYGHATAGAILASGHLMADKLAALGLGPAFKAIPGNHLIGAIPAVALAEAGKRLGIVGENSKLEASLQVAGTLVHAFKSVASQHVDTAVGHAERGMHQAAYQAGKATRVAGQVAAQPVRDTTSAFGMVREAMRRSAPKPSARERAERRKVNATHNVATAGDIDKAASEFYADLLTQMRTALAPHIAKLEQQAQAAGWDFDRTAPPFAKSVAEHYHGPIHGTATQNTFDPSQERDDHGRWIESNATSKVAHDATNAVPMSSNYTADNFLQTAKSAAIRLSKSQDEPEEIRTVFDAHAEAADEHTKAANILKRWSTPSAEKNTARKIAIKAHRKAAAAHVKALQEIAPLLTRNAFDFDQQRDDHGRWSSNGGSGTKSQAETKTAISYGDVTKKDTLGNGNNANATFIVTLENGMKGVWKPRTGEAEGLRDTIASGTYWRREAAASDVADAIGMSDIVPATVVRSIDGEEGSLQEFCENAYTGGTLPMKEGDPVVDGAYPAAIFDGEKDCARLAAFDVLTGATDRHYGNMMIQGSLEDIEAGRGKLKAIDHGLCFPDENGEFVSKVFNFANSKQMTVPKEVLNWNASKIESAMRNHDLPPEAIAGTLKRLELLKQWAREEKTFPKAKSDGSTFLTDKGI